MAYSYWLDFFNDEEDEDESWKSGSNDRPKVLSPQAKKTGNLSPEAAAVITGKQPKGKASKRPIPATAEYDENGYLEERRDNQRDDKGNRGIRGFFRRLLS